MIRLRIKKQQFDIDGEAAKISALSSCKINEHECLAGEEILPSNQQQIIEQDKFTYSPLGKPLKIKQKLLKIKEKNRLML